MTYRVRRHLRDIRHLEKEPGIQSQSLCQGTAESAKIARRLRNPIFILQVYRRQASRAIRVS